MPKSSSSQPAVVDNYRRARYEEEHFSPVNQRRIAYRQQLYQEEHDAQLAIALSSQERSDVYDLDTALALSKSMMDSEILPINQGDYNEEQALSLAQAMSISELEDGNKETSDEQPQKSDGELLEAEEKKFSDIEDDQFKNIGDVSKDALTGRRHII